MTAPDTTTTDTSDRWWPTEPDPLLAATDPADRRWPDDPLLAEQHARGGAR